MLPRRILRENGLRYYQRDLTGPFNGLLFSIFPRLVCGCVKAMQLKQHFSAFFKIYPTICISFQMFALFFNQCTFCPTSVLIQNMQAALENLVRPYRCLPPTGRKRCASHPTSTQPPFSQAFRLCVVYLNTTVRAIFNSAGLYR